MASESASRFLEPFAAVRFDDPRKAEGNLERVAKRLAPGLMRPLASLLGESPDPDGALNLLDRYVEGAPADILDELPQAPAALTYLAAIFGYSADLAEAFLSEPALPLALARDRHFAKLKSREDLMQDYARFSTTSPDPWLSAQLARFKRRNTLRIVLKDVLGLSTLGETTLELSALADVILSNALNYCDQELAKRYGQPQYRDAQGRIARAGFAIVSLGKLGGNELNYSSDIDLLFLYSRDGETSGGTERDSLIANKEYFVRLAHAITRTVTQTTHHGLVYRVDLRLRPEGEQGDLAISVRSSLEYYEHRARDWELQMLIKARHSAGDGRITREFLRGVEPYVYSAPADFGAIESVLHSRQQMSRKLQREGRAPGSIDVKLDRGGIRDIEFLSQCLQRLYGLDDPWVRSGGTLHGLRKLNDKRLLSDSDYAGLTSSYEFLRKIEHRIQLDLGQQTHRLPVEPLALDRLARRMGITASSSQPSRGAAASVESSVGAGPGAELLDRVRAAFGVVDQIYQRVIHPRVTPEARSGFNLRPLPGLPGDHAPHSFESVIRFLDAQAPEVSRALAGSSIPDRARADVARFVAALLRSSEQFRIAREQPALVERAVEVIGSSEYLGSLLIHHPEDLEVLQADEAGAGTAMAAMAERENFEAGRASVQIEMALGATAGLAPSFPLGPSGPPGEPGAEGRALGARPKPVGWAEPFPWAVERGLDIREKMALLRRQYRARVLSLGAADLAGSGPPGSIFAALGRWSGLAARSIASGLEIACQAAGVDPSFSAGSSASLPLAVLGLGRLGLNEFDLASDADVIFVAKSGTPPEEIAFWTRVAEKTIEVLSSYTREGTLFAVDTRLRPQGREGELVITEDELVNYADEGARVWEGLTYLKASPVAGNLELGEAIVTHLIGRLLDRFGHHPELERELVRMRRRLETELHARPYDTKTGEGGYYDIDFCLSYLRLRCRPAELQIGANTLEQVTPFVAAGAIDQDAARTLTEGAAVLRSVDHAVRLVTGRAASGLPERAGPAECVEALLRRWDVLESGEPLPPRLRSTQQQVRGVYRRVLGAD